jgi:hypothetical protein
MTLHELELEINQFFLDSEKEADGNGRTLGVYPNAVILTQEHYKEFLRELFKTQGDAEIPDGVLISSICGLKVIFSEDVEKPKVVRITRG